MHRASNQHRDTVASHIGHYDMMSYFAVAQNDSIGRVRYQLLEVSVPAGAEGKCYFINTLHNLLQKMLQPCGPPPVRQDDDDN